MRPRQVMRAHVWQRHPEGIRNAGCAVVTDRPVLEIFLVGGELRQDRLHDKSEGAPRESSGEEKARDDCDDGAGGAPIGGRLHALPSEIKADRLGSAEEQIVQPEYDVAAADHGEEGEPGEPAHNGKHSGEAMRAGIDRGGYIEA